MNPFDQFFGDDQKDAQNAPDEPPNQQREHPQIGGAGVYSESVELNVDAVLDARGYSRQRSARAAVTEKPLNAFIAHVPPHLCDPTADFNPFQFWNRSKDDIDLWTKEINEAIQTAVDRHHQGFNQATTEFDEILQAFHDSEIKFKRLVHNLMEARKLLHQSRGANGKTASISSQWRKFEDLKKKLKELDKIEYMLEIPQIYDKYLAKKQFIHATVLLSDGLSLYNSSLTGDSVHQLKSCHDAILGMKNDLEVLLRQQLYQQIYFKTNSLRSNLLRPPKRNKTNQNILNLLNFQLFSYFIFQRCTLSVSLSLCT